MNLQLVAYVLERAGHLFCLALAPSFLPPEPALSAHSAIGAFMSAAALALVVVAAFRLRSKVPSPKASVAAGLIAFAVAAAVAGGAVIRGEHAPLGRGIFVVAIPLWSGLALAVWVALGRYFDDRDKTKRLLAAVVTLGVGAVQLAASASWLFSVERMWWVTLVREGDTSRALVELTKSTAGARDVSAMRGIVDRCLGTNPTSCACLAKRSDLARKSRDFDAALADAQLAVSTCPADGGVQLALVAALVSKGDAARAEQTARAALVQNGQDPRFHYALAVALEGQGRLPDAAASAKRAADLGGGRDAELFAAALSIVTGDLDGASNLLKKLVAASPNDAEAHYNLALVADKKNDYNRAREGYLAALKADPTLANARYNLALLTFRRGVIEESRHHARKFAEISPGDPRIADLMRRLDGAKRPSP